MKESYQPDAEAARLAPAAICNTVSRIFWLRKMLPEFPSEVQRKLQPFVAPFPFEDELMSGNMERVDAAIKRIGAATPEEVNETGDPEQPEWVRPMNADAALKAMLAEQQSLRDRGIIRTGGGHIKPPRKDGIKTDRLRKRRSGMRRQLFAMHSVRVDGVEYVDCYWCGGRMEYDAYTIDHVLPLSQGGAHAIENTVPACEPCNFRRGSKLPHNAAKALANTVPTKREIRAERKKRAAQPLATQLGNLWPA